MSLASLLNQTADLQSRDYTSDSSAGIKPWNDPGTTITTVLTAQPVRIEDASAREINDYGSRNIEITHRVLSQTNTPQNGNRWVYDDRYFIVKDILRRRAIGGIDSFYINMCSEVAPNG